MSELYNLEVHPNGLSFTATDAEGWMGQSLEVLAKWDGCMQIRRRFNEGVEENDIDNIHICDINHFIAFLEAVRDEGVRRYPDEWAMPEGK